jgi:dGTPase
MIDAVVEESLRGDTVRMDADTLEVMNELRDFMFERVYFAPAHRAPQIEAIDVIRRLVDHHLLHPDEMPSTYRDNDADVVTQVADYVAGMTDRFALATHQRIFGTPGMADPAL